MQNKDVHCLSHRLKLALLKLKNSCKSVDDVYNVLNLIWKINSLESIRALKSITDNSKLTAEVSEIEIAFLDTTVEKGKRFKNKSHK